MDPDKTVRFGWATNAVGFMFLLDSLAVQALSIMEIAGKGSLSNCFYSMNV